MKKSTSELREDVSDLLERVTVEEANQSIWNKLDHALSSLDPQSQEILNDYFNGTSIQELSRKHSLSVAETQAWVHQIKRKLISQLQRKVSTRH